MPRLVLLGVIVVAAVIIYAVIDCLMSSAREVRSISKPAWLATIVLLPVLGAILWFLFGRPGRRPEPRPRANRHPTAPDDDPEFLRNLEIRRRQKEKEAELKRREQELADREKRSKQNDDEKPSSN
ncbi:MULTISPECIES: PLD nuclease N-terminal domain-containing protein [Arthrobacter]|uniref:PLD nuclease N-terminal domain-containing protein n=1 Tax=Arthrobacter caoxuetaonis TaxID=2886935 RepID=A0A9X1MCA2_9MICC|nr:MULTISPECIES: PLD nuclease N-terminal domain-containing protein [Arthrobacter]MCC3281370.1 PLD nuclease N-terminal domain-containing protein [Arthrobacter caoxuetaonis]MCC3296377.1 PLD nuclease N-terminal domain-containing protein [Arthrobacter caoxuetaonis]MCC9192453.1 PLD nuclease N-terminal domain-containing protein [Arthrobacter sp. zg-Y916]USQ56782.1 PLD nuclease N-terminal domain-containing protein [Arthrobacter caoxuetaonis]